MTDTITTLTARPTTDGVSFTTNAATPVGFVVNGTVYTSDAYEAAVGTSVTFTADPGNVENPVHYDWDLGDGTMAAGIELEHTYKVANPHMRVRLTVTDTDGKEHYASKQFYVIRDPDGAEVEDRKYWHADRVLQLEPDFYLPLTVEGGLLGDAPGAAAQGGLTIGGVTGPLGHDTATHLDGSNDHITSSYSPFAGAGDTLTFAGWAYRDASASGDSLFGGAGVAPPLLRLNSGGNAVQFWSDTSTAGHSFGSVWPGNTVWVHWALTWDNAANTAELFINGASVGSVTEADAYGTPGALQVGAYAGATDPFDGVMTHFAVWERILTDPEIALLADQYAD